MTQFNEDELEAPQWLNKGFFEQVLKTNENGNEVEMKNIIITPGTEKGDHYASIMFRAKLNYEIQTTREQKCRSMIIKTMPVTEGHKKEFLESKSFFETEIGMYSEVLPKVENILKEIGDETELCARVLYYSLKPHKCIIFEDLKEKNYIVASDCTLEEVKVALTKLAKYHAVTYKLIKEGDKSLFAYEQQMFSLNERSKAMFSNTVKVLANATKKYSALRKYASHMERLDEHFVCEAVSLVAAERVMNETNILILSHGDFHKKNMMMKYNEGALQSLLLLDFQMSSYGSIVQDLLYAYFMLFTPKMRLFESRKELFSYYFVTFQQTLKALNYCGPIPTTVDFENELETFKSFELFLLAFMLPIGYCLGDSINDLSDLANPKTQEKVYERPELLNELEHLLQRYVDEGYFESWKL